MCRFNAEEKGLYEVENAWKELLATLHFYNVDALYGDSVYSLTRRVSRSKWCPFLRRELVDLQCGKWILPRDFVTRSDNFLNSKRRDGLKGRVVWIKR